MFTVKLVSVVGSNFTSTATLTTNVTSSLNISCDDNGDTVDSYIAMLLVQGKQLILVLVVLLTLYYNSTSMLLYCPIESIVYTVRFHRSTRNLK